MLTPENVVSVTPLCTCDGHRLVRGAGDIHFPDRRIRPATTAVLIAAGDMPHVGDAERASGVVPPLQLPPVPNVPLAAAVVQFLSRRHGIADVQARPDAAAASRRLRIDHDISAGEHIRADDAVDDVARIAGIRDIEHDHRHVV